MTDINAATDGNFLVQSTSLRTVKQLFKRFAREAFDLAAISDTVEDLASRTPGDEAVDSRFRSLDSFEPALGALRSLPIVAELYPTESGDRITLQFIYSMFYYLEFSLPAPIPISAVTPETRNSVFELAWTRFQQELRNPYWINCNFASLIAPKSDISVASLGYGTRICQLDDSILLDLGWPKSRWDAYEKAGGFLRQRFFYGRTIILAIDRQPKAPGGGRQADKHRSYEKIQSAITAMRLLKPGNLNIGPMFMSRTGHNLTGDLRGGYHSSPEPLLALVSPYSLNPKDVPAVKIWFARLLWLSATPEYASIKSALRWFMSSYERHFGQAQDSVVDLVTSIEALVSFGQREELTFKSAFRAAAIIARSDEERVRVFQEVKAWYALRSKIVHGEVLKPDQWQKAREFEPLREIVRQLLRVFIYLAAKERLTPKGEYRGKKLNDHIDMLLLHSAERNRFRRDCGLTRSERIAISTKEARVDGH